VKRTMMVSILFMAAAWAVLPSWVSAQNEAHCTCEDGTQRAEASQQSSNGQGNQTIEITQQNGDCTVHVSSSGAEGTNSTVVENRCHSEVKAGAQPQSAPALAPALAPPAAPATAVAGQPRFTG
jgi:hypothetical protein